MHPRQIDWVRLERYIASEGTPEELAASERWVRTNPELMALAVAMSSIGQPDDVAHVWDEQAMWQRIRRRMPWYEDATRVARVSGATPVVQARTHGRSPLAWTRAAAAAATVLLLASTYSVLSRGAPTVAQTSVLGEPSRDVTTRSGQRAVLELSDGTRVTLGAESRLRIPASFRSGSGPRDIELVGQAYFLVHKDTARPFRVHTSAGIAEDRGTAFVVTAHPETRGMQVVVTEGLVALRRSGTADAAPPLAILTRGNLARLDRGGTATMTTAVDIPSFLAWTHGEIRFTATPLSDALPVLSHWYGLDIRIADSLLARRRITASFTDKSPQEVLDALSLLLPGRFEHRGNTIIVHAAFPSTS